MNKNLVLTAVLSSFFMVAQANEAVTSETPKVETTTKAEGNPVDRFAVKAEEAVVKQPTFAEKAVTALKNNKRAVVAGTAVVATGAAVVAYLNNEDAKAAQAAADKAAAEQAAYNATFKGRAENAWNATKVGANNLVASTKSFAVQAADSVKAGYNKAADYTVAGYNNSVATIKANPVTAAVTAGVVTVAAAGVAYYFYSQNQDTNDNN